jgi:hypothetical protein
MILSQRNFATVEEEDGSGSGTTAGIITLPSSRVGDIQPGRQIVIVDYYVSACASITSGTAAGGGAAAAT